MIESAAQRGLKLTNACARFLGWEEESLTHEAHASEHHILVIGGSSGSLSPLRGILSTLPAALPASVLVVLHLAPDLTNPAPLLTGHTRWAVRVARDGERLSTGHVYICPANRHLALQGNVMRVFYGPRENGSRPAIDVLFRSAAVHHGARVSGVLLSGALSDGSAGLAAIRRCGGATFVQAPHDAFNGDMPRSALRMTSVDHAVPTEQVSTLLSDRIRRPAGESPPVPRDLRLEADMALRAADAHHPVEELGEHVPLSCPECNGPMSYLSRAEGPVYRCHVGHSYDTESMLAAHSLALERALWVAFRTLKERGVLLAKMAEDARSRGYSTTAQGFEDHLRELEQHAASVHRAIAAAGQVPHGESSDGDA